MARAVLVIDLGEDVAAQEGRLSSSSSATPIVATFACSDLIMAIGMASGIAVGGLLGTALFDNLAMGITAGIALGAACGYFLKSSYGNGQ